MNTSIIFVSMHSETQDFASLQAGDCGCSFKLFLYYVQKICSLCRPQAYETYAQPRKHYRQGYEGERGRQRRGQHGAQRAGRRQRRGNDKGDGLDDVGEVTAERKADVCLYDVEDDNQVTQADKEHYGEHGHGRRPEFQGRVGQGEHHEEHAAAYGYVSFKPPHRKGYGPDGVVEYVDQRVSQNPDGEHARIFRHLRKPQVQDRVYREAQRQAENPQQEEGELRAAVKQLHQVLVVAGSVRLHDLRPHGDKEIRGEAVDGVAYLERHGARRIDGRAEKEVEQDVHA